MTSAVSTASSTSKPCGSRSWTPGTWGEWILFFISLPLLPFSLFYLPFSLICLFLLIFSLFFLSSFISLPGVMVAVITIRKGDSSVITSCQHTGSFLYHLRPKTKSHAFIFLSGDCEGHMMSSSNSQFKWFRQDFALWPDLMLTIICNCGCIWLY